MARPEPERSRATTIAGVLLAVGGALLGAARSGTRPESGAGAKAPEAPATPPDRGGRGPAGRPGAPSRPKAAQPKAARSNVRTEPRPPEEPPRTRYWPPPAPKPVEPSSDDAHAAEARDAEVPVDPRSEALGYEVADTRVAHLVKLMAISTAAIVGSIVGLFVFIGHSQRVDRSGPPLTPQQLAVIVPPGPRLQDHPLADIASERLRETDRLKSYAWADPDHRTARIPIARAQSLVIGRSLDPVPPDRAAAPPPAAAP